MDTSSLDKLPPELIFVFVECIDSLSALKVLRQTCKYLDLVVSYRLWNHLEFDWRLDFDRTQSSGEHKLFVQLGGKLDSKIKMKFDNYNADELLDYIEKCHRNLRFVRHVTVRLSSCDLWQSIYSPVKDAKRLILKQLPSRLSHVNNLDVYVNGNIITPDPFYNKVVDAFQADNKSLSVDAIACMMTNATTNAAAAVRFLHLLGRSLHHLHLNLYKCNLSNLHIPSTLETLNLKFCQHSNEPVFVDARSLVTTTKLRKLSIQSACIMNPHGLDWCNAQQLELIGSEQVHGCCLRRVKYLCITDSSTWTNRVKYPNLTQLVVHYKRSQAIIPIPRQVEVLQLDGLELRHLAAQLGHIQQRLETLVITRPVAPGVRDIDLRTMRTRTLVLDMQFIPIAAQEETLCTFLQHLKCWVVVFNNNVHTKHGSLPITMQDSTIEGHRLQ